MDSIIRVDGSAPRLTIQAMADLWRALESQAPQPIAWTIRIPAGTYKLLWNMQRPMRKKIARIARQSRQ